MSCGVLREGDRVQIRSGLLRGSTGTVVHYNGHGRALVEHDGAILTVPAGTKMDLDAAGLMVLDDGMTKGNRK